MCRLDDSHRLEDVGGVERDDWFLWLIVRGTGKRSISELTPLELIFTFVIGDLVQQAVTGEDMSMTGGIIVISTFAAWMLTSDFLTHRSKRWERILEGEAVVVLRDGQPDMARLRSERLTIEDLLSAAREKGFGSLSRTSALPCSSTTASSVSSASRPERTDHRDAAAL